MSSTIYAFWCRRPSYRNFGDALTPWLIKKITGGYPNFLRPEERLEKYLVVGSIISYANAHSTVWGSGIIRRDDIISPRARLLAVRGPLTRARALECGAVCPEIYGDPALFLPRLYQPCTSKGKRLMGVVPHFLDKASVVARWPPSSEIRLIDIQQPVETVIDEITSCRYIASSSLHGIIAAHAYGIPALWVAFSNRPHGDGSKFRDYFLSVGQPPPEPVSLDGGRIDLEWLIPQMSPVQMDIDLDRLWQVCPFRTIP